MKPETITNPNDWGGKRKGAGRKKTENPYTEYIVVRVTPDQKNDVLNEAKRRNQNLTEFCRETILNALKRSKKTNS